MRAIRRPERAETQLPGGLLQSDIADAFKTLNLASGVQDAALSVSGDIGAVTIKGSILGSAIRSDGKIGALKISGDLAASATSAATISARGATTVSDALAFGKIPRAPSSTPNPRWLLPAGAAANVDASIGAVTWAAIDASDWSRAPRRTGGLFVTGGGPLVSAAIRSFKIASIVIKHVSARGRNRSLRLCRRQFPLQLGRARMRSRRRATTPPS